MRPALLITLLLFGISFAPRSNRSAPSLQQDPLGQGLALTSTEIAALVNECGDRTSRMTTRLFDFRYTEIDTEYELDKSGRLTGEHSKVYEVNPIRIGNKGQLVHVQIAENGMALSSDKVAHERERIVKELIQAEGSAARQENQANPAGPYKPKYWSYGIKVEKRGGMSRTIWAISPTDFLRSHEFFAPRRLVVNSRETILLRFRPRPDYVFDKTNVSYPQGIEEYGRVMAQLGGRVWIDATDRVIARLEAMPVVEMSEGGAFAKDWMSPGAPLIFEFERLQNGTWVPSRSWYNSYGRENLFWKTAASRAQMYSDFKMFKTTVQVEELEPSPEKPE